ncbi:MAG: T9SS type A sorting domain-containing protein [Bacteroidetes bacterium]|nr:T9SS type A sorting domain-containing protein [Bacteroidota bacterium]MBP7400667.1 T9SS type A sorting domain-containing protein [Chitinophagales bacterium]MBK8488450.1 T9SS type A sorting domain-containing protein [Bacteroidota bacterium]MBK8681787.1 T9SS type A sorting domain-containing protein [Bacteroidota bacterium]MBP9549950.1 T9SS type A sorting domain-containing protein [Chitinophagales bacterium]
MKSILLCIAAAISCCYTFAQQDANWVFGDSAGLYFHDGIVESFTTSMQGYDASASISDSDGNLLFYTNGIYIWNKYHELMTNGDSLQIGGLPYGVEYGSSITQGVIIVPKPDYYNQYYIFYIKDFGLAYALVDMSDSTGIVLDKNIEIYDKSLTEKMQAVKHANGCDWWLVLRGWPDVLVGDSAFYFLTYLITASGIEGPFFQYYGEEYEFENISGVGQMKFTQDGSKVALIRNTYIDIYDFDRSTGLFSNWQTINNVFEYGAYGLEWSSDKTKLYATGNYGPAAKTQLVQYCFNCKSILDSTRTLIFKESFEGFALSQMEIGSDSKIYITISHYIDPNWVYDNYNKNLSVINKPNLEGSTCDFDTLTISLGGHRVKYGLPNIPNYNLGALPGYECDSIIISATDGMKENNIALYPNPSNGYLQISGIDDYNIPAQITITDLSGNMIESFSNKYLTTPIDVSALSNGLYIITIIQGGQMLLQDKFLILKNN